jgi:hypothetical protein
MHDPDGAHDFPDRDRFIDTAFRASRDSPAALPRRRDLHPVTMIFRLGRTAFTVPSMSMTFLPV